MSTRETGSAAGLDAGVRMVTRERVESLLEALDPVDRSMLILKEVEGFSVGEIARMMELNGNTVKVRLFRARRRMVELHRKRALKESRQD
ncbi:MAG: sigma-70 region 4 domain-containing protein [Acidobacteriia bacterium]|nr:sigma-70 region 4 domain-containing protein [Terriglobia bacterium]